MSLIFDWFDKIKRYAFLKPGETRAVIIAVIVIGFIISFDKWGPDKEIDFVVGFTNLLVSIVLVAVIFYLRLLFQKIVSLGADLQAEFKLWSLGLMLGLVVVFITNGKLWFLIPGGIVIHYMPGHRVGWVRYGLNYFGVGIVGLAGPIANILLAMIFIILFKIFSVEIFYTAFILNLVWAIWTILPIPPADGSRIFFGSRMVYMFGLAIVVSSAILLYSDIPIIITIPASFLIASLWWLIYYVVWERFNWKGPY
ncbi:hypothetical protein GF323_00885 [Candidatus Woesearchaeota archaeon]|nr:hypothetical protein [Candidatus Woesearchaeota archaeon]